MLVKSADWSFFPRHSSMPDFSFKPEFSQVQAGEGIPSLVDATPGNSGNHPLKTRSSSGFETDLNFNKRLERKCVATLGPLIVLNTIRPFCCSRTLSDIALACTYISCITSSVSDVAVYNYKQYTPWGSIVHLPSTDTVYVCASAAGPFPSQEK